MITIAHRSIRTALVSTALLGGVLAGPTGAAHAATEVEAAATIRFQGRLTDVVSDGEGSCDYTATVRVRGRTDDGRAVRANRLPFNATAPCDNELRVGVDIRGTGDVDLAGQAGGRNGPIRIERATGLIGFGAETTVLTAPASFGPVTRGFLLDGDLLGRVDVSTPKGAGVVEYSLTAQIDGVTDDGYRLRPTRYTEVEWTVIDGPPIEVGSRIEGTISGEATGTTSGRWIDVLSFSGEITVRVADTDAPPITGFAGFGAETSV